MEEKGRFSATSFDYASVLFRIKGTSAGKDINISIALAESNNYISLEFANQLMAYESNIIEKLDLWNKTQWHNRLTIKHWGLYIYITVLCSISMKRSMWHNSRFTLDGITRVVHFKYEDFFLTFSYKKKKIMLQLITLKLDSVTLEDIKNISKLIL